MNGNTRIIGAAIGLSILGSSTHADSLDPPPIRVMNKHGVSMANGRPSPTLNDVSIGDKTLGLTHSISTYSGNMVNDGIGDEHMTGPYGPKEKFAGVLRLVLHHVPIGHENDLASWVYVMRAFDTGGSMDFSVNADGTFTAYNRDPRNILETVQVTGGSGWAIIWTKPDGSTSTYASYAGYDPRNVNNRDKPLNLTKMQAANGFTVYIQGGEEVANVATNTGYQLKYIYSQADPSLPYDDPSNNYIPPIGWGTEFPKYVVGINNTVDYCDPRYLAQYPDVASACPGLTKSWPTATYLWPSGMPRAMFLKDNSLIVLDAEGGQTEYKHHPYALPPEANDPKSRFVRLVGIKSSHALVPEVTYDYVTKMTVPTISTSGGLYTSFSPAAPAVLSSSTVGSTILWYNINAMYQHPGDVQNSGGQSATTISNYQWGLWSISDVDFGARYDQMYSNHLLYTVDGVNVKSSYFYDGRYNINLIQKFDSVKNINVSVAQALYPTTCTNRKTCNLPLWTQDANGILTGDRIDYDYDPNSGQPTRIRRPANHDGIRPEIRYAYQPKYAYFKISASGFAQAVDPVYLLTQQKTCLKTATLTDGSGCTGGAADEIVTDYDYGPANVPSNLQLRGIAVSAYYGGTTLQVRRTCYQYDAFGNRIGEITPRAGLTSCN